MLENFGFGDFVFRLPDGTEVGRAPDLKTLVRLLRTVPVESIQHHASHDHFSQLAAGPHRVRSGGHRCGRAR